MQVDREGLLGLIAAAFDGVSREYGVSLHEAEAMDMYEPPEVCRAERERDTDRCWQEVPEEDLERFPTALSFFDTHGFRYYLPAYMAWDVRGFARPGGEPRSDLVWHLARGTGRHDLTDEQGHAVYRYLEFLADHGSEYRVVEVNGAIDKFWGRFRDLGPEHGGGGG